MMLDRDIVAVSPSNTYPHAHGHLACAIIRMGKQLSANRLSLPLLQRQTIQSVPNWRTPAPKPAASL
jgi:hypothetical protein